MRSGAPAPSTLTNPLQEPGRTAVPLSDRFKVPDAPGARFKVVLSSAGVTPEHGVSGVTEIVKFTALVPVLVSVTCFGDDSDELLTAPKEKVAGFAVTVALEALPAWSSPFPRARTSVGGSGAFCGSSVWSILVTAWVSVVFTNADFTCAGVKFGWRCFTSAAAPATS